MREPRAQRIRMGGTRSQTYAGQRITGQKIQVETYKEPKRRSFLQAQIIAENCPSSPLKILDIGCFDGALLSELDKLIGCSAFYGFDVNPYIEKRFPSADNFHFLTGSLSDIDERFDVICLSHSMIYIKNILLVTLILY